MKRLILVASLIGAWALSLSAQASLTKTDKLPTVDGSITSGEYQYEGNFSGMKILATLGTDDNLYLAIEAPTSGWVALGVGGRVMNGSRLFLGAMQGGKPAFIEKLGRGHFYVDAKDLVVKKWAVTSAGESSILELVLPASAAVWKGQINLVFAYAGSPDFTVRHKARGSTSLTINN
jgi:hypothetical protein